MANFKKRYIREVTSITGRTKRECFSCAPDAFDCVRSQYTKALYDKVEAGEVVSLKLGRLKLDFFKE